MTNESLCILILMLINNVTIWVLCRWTDAIHQKHIDDLQKHIDELRSQNRNRA